ncbi:MAG: LamG domain-containing protein [Planctomycetota bacterium]|jgi:hypothetical protein
MSKDKFFILVCVLGSAVLVLYGPAGVAQADMPTEGLVSYWTFDEGEGDTAYDSAGDHHGAISGAQWTDGLIGTSLDFNGAHDYVALGSPVLPMGNKSLFTWIKMPPVGHGSGEAYDFVIFWGLSRFYFDNGTTLRADNIWSGGYDATYAVALDDNKWHHLGFTYDGTNTLRMYMDGAEVATDIGNDQHSIEAPVCIGGHSHEPLNRSWLGKIDEVAVYNTALSVEEVEQLYLAGLGQLADLEIVGPPQIAENFSTSFKAIAHYDSGRTEDVTNLAEWDVDDDQTATIDGNGLLQAGPTALPRDVTIYAEYAEDDIAVAAEKMVSVQPICPTGSALDFDGADDSVEIGPGVLPVGDKSFFAWIKMPPVGQGSGHDPDYDCFIYVATTSLEAIFFYFDSGVRLRCWNNASGGFDAHYTVALDDDQWHFVGFTHDGFTLRLYLDGNEVATSNGNNLSAIPIIEYFGTAPGDVLERSWTGGIDEVRIYDRALSAEEIWENMHTKPTGDEAGLVAYWSFDEGEGQIAHDIAGGHDGYLGSDGENPDDSDPAWVESDAPAGICPPQALLERNISNALEIKQNILQQLDEALVSERAAEDLLRDMQRNRDTTELSPIQIIRARIKIVWAIIKEVWSQRKINQSKEHLEDSLEIVTQEPDLNPAGRPRQRRRSRR